MANWLRNVNEVGHEGFPKPKQELIEEHNEQKKFVQIVWGVALRLCFRRTFFSEIALGSRVVLGVKLNCSCYRCTCRRPHV